MGSKEGNVLGSALFGYEAEEGGSAVIVLELTFDIYVMGGLHYGVLLIML